MSQVALLVIEALGAAITYAGIRERRRLGVDDGYGEGLLMAWMVAFGVTLLVVVL